MTSEAEGSLAILRDSPDYFANVLCKLRVCHDLCVYSSVPVLGGEVKEKIDQCSVDFRHVSTQTARLAERVGSNWCATCILFFENLDKVRGDPGIITTRISKQASELSIGFTHLAKWIRELAGRFHDCQMLAGNDKEAYEEKVSEAMKYAERMKANANEQREKAREDLKAKEKSAGIWAVCALIPVVNFVALPGLIIADGQVQSAQHRELIALKELESAQKALEQAQNASEKAKVRDCCKTAWQYMIQ